MNRQDAFKIMEDFNNSLKTGNKKLIEKYTIEQLRMARYLVLYYMTKDNLGIGKFCRGLKNLKNKWSEDRD